MHGTNYWGPHKPSTGARIRGAVVTQNSSLWHFLNRPFPGKHIQETVIILFSCHEDLPWGGKKSQRAVCLDDLLVLGDTLLYFTKFKRAQSGMIPIHISDLNDREKREKDEQLKKVNWYRSRGFSATLFVPATPDSRLTNLIQASSDASTQGPRVRVMEKNGPTTRSILQRTDPSAKTPCSTSANCIPC